MKQPIKYLPGLNALRFFAAFFVVISHANLALVKLGIYATCDVAFLNRGGEAVDFFFTLSGFLITYLLIAEINSTATVSIKQFYLRRVFRIWPLYFLIVLIGFFLLGYVYPKIYHQPYFTFSITEGILLYVFFLPNYAAKNFMVGILNPLWSIGVEEQFYLFWAPIVKWFKGYLKWLIAFFIAGTILFYGIVYYQIFNIPANIERFLLTQKFYAMAIGSAFGYMLYFKLNNYNTSFFSSKAMQVIVWVLILYHFLVGFSFGENFVFKIVFAVLYGLLILNVSVINNKIFALENSTLSYLGVISYGIYMYHMLVDYFLRIVVQKTMFLHLPATVIVVMYYLLLLTITILIASLSYSYFEKYFLTLKNKMQHSSATAIN